MKSILIASLVLALPLTTTRAQQLDSLRNAEIAATTLKPGDVLRISVWRRPEFSGDFVIGPDGSITHPLYRVLKVTDTPMPLVESNIRTFLRQFETEPAFVLSPLLRVFVGGEVRTPNVYNVPPGTTIAQLVALAGGPSERGNLDRVEVKRGTDIVMLDLTHPDSVTLNMSVRSGDRIQVARSSSLLRDLVGPASSVIAAAAGITTIIVQLRR